MSSSQLLQLCKSLSFPHKQYSDDTKSQQPSATVHDSGRRRLWVISSCHNFAGRTFVTMDKSYMMTSIRKIETDHVIRAAHIRPQQPGPPVPPNPSSSPWNLWVVGMLISAALSFGNKISPLMKLKREVESAIEAAEQVVEEVSEKLEDVAEVVDEVLEKVDEVLEMVEEVSEKVDKVAEELAEQLPEDGKLKEAVSLIEHVAEETAKDAQLAQDILEKVEEVEEKMASLLGGVRPNTNREDENKKLP